MAIMTQVHVSRAKFANLSREYRTAREYRSVQRRLFRQIRSEASAERTGEQNLIRERMNTIVAEARYDIAYADLQNAYGNILASMGVDFVDMDLIASASLLELTGHIRRSLVAIHRARGIRAFMPKDPPSQTVEEKAVAVAVAQRDGVARGPTRPAGASAAP